MSMEENVGYASGFCAALRCLDALCFIACYSLSLSISNFGVSFLYSSKHNTIQSEYLGNQSTIHLFMNISISVDE